MSKTETGSTNKQYLSIVQGSLRQSVPEGTPDAVRREWEAGGDKGVKHEIVFKAITGIITDVNFFDGESNGRKFTNLNIVLDENESGKKPVISVGIGTRYASDILKKLPNVNIGRGSPHPPLRVHAGRGGQRPLPASRLRRKTAPDSRQKGR